jgi:hypothetical protein
LSGKPWLRLGVVAGGMFAACQFTHREVPPDSDTNVTPDAGMCTSLTNECVGDMLRYCKEVGGSAMDTPCGWGCIGGSDAHCAHVVPAGSGGVELDGVTPADADSTSLAALAAITLTDVTFDSDFGKIGTNTMPELFHNAMTGVDKGIDFQRRGTLIAMWRFKSLTLTGTIKLVGSRSIALVADGPITINGTVVASGECSSFIAGPGGFNGGSAAGMTGREPTDSMGGGQGAPTSSSGGGGGGHGSIGGNGETAIGGKAWGDPDVPTLFGGAGGGAGSGGGMFGRGGGGGGALQLVTNTSVVITTGGINAGGCGGKAGTGNADSGGGGGAGGTILIEAPTIMINGALAANGGGGGGGGGGNATSGGNGALDRTPALGGEADGNLEQGGAGAVGGTAAQAGGTGTNPGGGGGGIGRIRINTRNGSPVDTTSATLSPAPTDPEMAYSTGSAATR